MIDMTRRTFMGVAAMGAMSAMAANVAMAEESTEPAADPAYTFELEDPAEYWGENVAAPHTTRESAYEGVLPEFADVPLSDLYSKVIDVNLDVEDAVKPDGTVVPAVYVALRNKLNRIGAGIGNVPVATSYEMLQYLWTEEDAQHEVEMPLLQYFNAEDYAAVSGRTIEECTEICEDLSNRGMILRARRSGTTVYHLLPYINGFWEFNELRAWYENGGEGDGRDTAPEAAYAAVAAFDVQGIGGKGGRGSFGNMVPLFHTYPVNVDVVEEDEIAPYMDWQRIVRANEKITVSSCQCRLMWKAFGISEVMDAQNHPFETCLSFGELAEYFAEIGIGRYITQEEALEIGRHAFEDCGMVPESISIRDVDILCMCHGECCGNLSGFKANGGAGASNVNMNPYLLKYFKDKCIQCGACISRCPMDAITFEESLDGYCLMNNTCVRCGQCVIACPVDARILSYRGDYPEMGRDYLDGVIMLAEDRYTRGDLYDFAGGQLDEK